MNIFRYLIVSLIFLISAGTALAQVGASVVTGKVQDANAQAVANAAVRLVNVEKGFTRTVTSTEDGTFNFPNVPPDTYQIEVEAAGFKKAIQQNVIALVDKTTSIDVALEVGAVTEVVEVTTGTIDSIANTTDASLGNNFVAKQIIELPLEGRNVGDLLGLQPGVTPDGSVAGGRSDQANITLDGVDVNDQQLGTAFSPVLRVTPDSVEEFRVTTSNADASKGRSSGAQISLSTKSGTNEFRGALYEYHRNTVTTANNFFNNAAGRYTADDPAVVAGTATAGEPRIGRPQLIRNLFGGSLGGPIVKNRLFFFYNYEGLREAREESVVRTVPLASLGQGSVKFQDEDGNIVTLTSAQINALTANGQPNGAAVINVNPAALAVLADAARRYPANDFSIGDGLNTAGFRFNATVPSATNTHTGRIDWKLTSDESQTMLFRGIFQDDFFTTASQFPDTQAIRRESKPFGIVVGHNWVISPNLVNNFRFGFTRQNFKDNGDSTDDVVTFRGVFAPSLFARPFSRRTDTTNFTNDLSWILGNHTLQFGGNIRAIRNRRSDEDRLYDTAVINRSYYQSSGAVLTRPVIAAGYSIDSDFELTTRDALAAVFGRFPDYTLNTNFNVDGSLLAAGSPIIREFATEEYDVYVQDTWKARPNLTITAGLRYGLSRPVYETNGYQAKPSVSLQEYLDRRIAASERGENYTEPLTVNLAGPANNGENYYPWDKNNFQPRIAVAWSPNFKGGILRRIFGGDSASVFRGGFAITNDYFGQQLAVNFDAENTLGFASSLNIAPNTYNVTNRPGIEFQAFNTRVRSLQGILLTPPSSISFPQTLPLDDARRIEGSLDSNLVSPINYQWNFTYGRKIPFGLFVEASYVGRIAKNLLATRDVMTVNNIRDPQSGQTWYEAAGILENARRNRTPISQIGNLPFFENLYPANSIDPFLFGLGFSNTQAAYAFMATRDTNGCVVDGEVICFESGTDWTFLQDVLDQIAPDIPGARQLFYQRQYGALSAFGTIASSNYHAGTLSIRQRFSDLTWDLNYTFGKSLDDASGLQSSGVYGTAFILNALRPEDSRGPSDFDIRHIVNFNGVYQLPIGRGKAFLGNLNPVANAFLGGWQVTSIVRWNTGAPIDNFLDVVGWPTNWNARSRVVRVRPVSSSPSRNVNGRPNLFSDPEAAYRSFRSPGPGETGDRNVLRAPSYLTVDLGFAKSFGTFWGNENDRIQFRWEIFNIANTQRFDGNSISDQTFGLDPQLNGNPSPNFGVFTGIQGSPRVMQFALRYDF